MDPRIYQIIDHLNRNEPYASVCRKFGVKITDLRSIVSSNLEEFVAKRVANVNEFEQEVLKGEISHSKISAKYKISQYLISVYETLLLHKSVSRITKNMVQAERVKYRCHKCGVFSILIKGDEFKCKSCEKSCERTE